MTRVWSTALALALFAAGMWFAWLGWDHQYYKINGVYQGPYRPWQVEGCGLSIVVATVIAFLVLRRNVAIFVLASAATIGFSAPWSVDAARQDETGLWMVGLFMLLVGGSLGLMALLGITAAIRSARGAHGG